jgi:SagB-type dehydrogenase family enzyme
VRTFAQEALTLEEIGQLLWAAQGVTSPEGLRTAPSAGALYPLEIYTLTAEGLHHYHPDTHTLELWSEGDRREDLAAAALGQDSLRQAPLILVFTAVYNRTEAKYGAARGPRYVHMEAGHSGQNVLLQAEALGLAGVPIGAFYDDQVGRVLNLPEGESPLYLIPLGHPAE